MDQSRVRSGFDAEIALEGRYLQYLLLLAADVGLLPTEVTFGADPVTIRLQQSPEVDRTYEPHPDAPVPEITSRDDAFAVEILHGHPLGADVRITLRLHGIKPSANLDIEGLELGVFVKLGLDTTRDPDGPALSSISLTTQLVDVDGPLVAIADSQGTPKAELLDLLRPFLDRTFALDDLGSGGRLADLALRKLEADPVSGAPAVLVLYVNLVLRSGPHADSFLGPRGDVALGENVLEPDADITFATRPGLLNDFGNDAYHRRAVPSIFGFDHPLKLKGKRVGKFVDIDAGPADPPVLNQLHIAVEAEYKVDYLPDPNFTIHIHLSQSVDDDGIMSWNTGLDVQSGLLAHIVMGLVSLALVPLLGPWSLLVFVGLEIARYVTEEIIEEVYEDRAEARVDATLLDIAPNRFTIVRRRWDPLFTTTHQIGLRPGGTLVTDQGFAIWGRAALTRGAEAAPRAVIRQAVRDEQDRAVALRYDVTDIDPFLPELTDAVVATHREPFDQHDPGANPTLFTIPVEGDDAGHGAFERVQVGEVRGAHAYVAEAIETFGNQIEHLLVISEQERNIVRGVLLAAHEEAVTDPIRIAHVADITAAVLAEFAAIGLIPTQEMVDGHVAARLRALVLDELAAYEKLQLPDDLFAAIESLLRFELSPNELGRLEDGDLIHLLDYDLIQLRASKRFYYRDRYIRSEEPTLAKRLADNLRNKRRYRTTPDGRVFL